MAADGGRPAGQGPSLPLPVELTDPPLAARSGHPLPLRQRGPQVLGRGQDMGGDQPGSDPQRRVQAGFRRRADHDGQHRRRGLRHDLRLRGVAASRRTPVDGQRRRPRPHFGRQRRQLAQHHPVRHTRVGDCQRHRAVGPRSRARVHCGPSLPGGRLSALHFPHRRLRRQLDPAHRRQQRHPCRPLRKSGARGPGSQGPALRRHRVRDVRFL